MRLTEEELREIAERAEKATRGPWKVYETVHEEDNPYLAERKIGTAYDHPQLKGPNPIVTNSVCRHEPHNRLFIEENDAAFIAASRTDIPRLLEDIKDLRESLHQIRQYARECWNEKKPPMAWRVATMANDALKVDVE